ncbi:MAG: ArnT family glycosyltransferase [bacterium]
MKENKRILILFAAIIVFLFLQLPYLTAISKVWVDEPWYGGTAYNFSQGRGFTNENVVGMYGGDVIFGYPLLLGSFMKLFGGSLFTARLFSVICGVLLLLIVYFILKELKVSAVGTASFYALFVLSSTVYIAFRTVRPESVKIIFSSLSLLFLLKGINKNNLYFILSGSLITFAALCHPDETMFAVAMGILLAAISFKRRKPAPFLLFAAGVAFTGLLFLLFLYLVKDMTLYDFYLYYGRRLSVYEGTLLGNLILKAKNLISEYALGLKRIYVLLFETLIFLCGILFLRKNKNGIILSLLGGAFFFFSLVFLERIVSRGFISIILYSSILFSLMIDSSGAKTKPRKLLVFVGAAYILNNLAAVGYVIYRDRDNTSYSVVESFIDENVKDGKVVLSHINYYFPLKNNILYNDYTIYKLTPKGDLDSIFSADEIDYAVLSSSAISKETGTSGRKEKKESVEDFERFYYRALRYAEEKLTIIDSLKTKGYGTIYIYEKK